MAPQARRRARGLLAEIRQVPKANEGNFFIAPAEKATVYVTADESFFSKLWQSYYNAVTIPARKNDKQMKKSMPVRYWKFLPEKQGQLDGEFL